jgi:hypothetical protein
MDNQSINKLLVEAKSAPVLLVDDQAGIYTAHNFASGFGYVARWLGVPNETVDALLVDPDEASEAESIAIDFAADDIERYARGGYRLYWHNGGIFFISLNGDSAEYREFFAD